MKRSERRVSLSGIQSAEVKPFTSAAMRVGRSEASNFVIGPTPLRPLRRLSQAWGTPMPTGDTIPRPVTTTLRFDMRVSPPERGRLALLLGVALDVIDGLLDVGDLLRFLVGDLALELFLDGHHELDVVEGIGAHGSDARGLVLHVGL